MTPQEKLESGDGKVPDYFINWTNTIIDWIFMFTTIMICYQVTWVLMIFASVQLGSTLLTGEVNRVLVFQKMEKLSPKNTN